MTTASTSNLGPTLRAMREGAGMSLDDMATAVGLDKSTISRFETGKRDVKPESLAKITRAIADALSAKKGRAA